MAVPFRKVSKTRKRMRRSHNAMEIPGMTKCPKCGEKYYATIDDHVNPSLYVAMHGKQPSSMLDREGKKRSIEIKDKLFELLKEFPSNNCITDVDPINA